MKSYIVGTRDGQFVVVAGAKNPDEAMKTVLSRAPELGIPVGARLASSDPFDPEPPIAMYLTAAS
jgi:hypothetical protein